MDVSHLLDSLNDRQREAVSAEPGHLLILAGAGSGKTRVLTQRIAWICEVGGLSPFAVLAVTFTNKAASEMRARVEALLGISAGAMWVGTFHGLAHRMLRAHWEAAKLPQTFQILDSDDQLRMVKRVTRQLDLDEANWPSKQAQWYINHNKDEGLRPAHIDPGNDHVKQQLLAIYRLYEELCQRAGVVDFAELLLRSLELIRDSITSAAFSISWWMSFRIPMRFNTPGYGCSLEVRHRYSWWATTINRFMAGAVRVSRISSISKRTLAAPISSGLSKTIVPPALF